MEKQATSQEGAVFPGSGSKMVRTMYFGSEAAKLPSIDAPPFNQSRELALAAQTLKLERYRED